MISKESKELSEKKQRLILTLIFGSIMIGVMWINNPLIEGISFREVCDRFLFFIIIGYAILFISLFVSNKTKPKQEEQKKMIQLPDENDPVFQRWLKLSKEANKNGKKYSS